MNGDLTPYRPGALSRGETKAARRELARLEAQAETQLARIEMAALLQDARVRAVAHVTQQALHATAMVSELEGQLGRLVPTARPRLQGIADIGCLGLAETVAATVQKVAK